jgi:hypothetical protein
MKDMIVDCDFSRLVWFKLLLWISSTIQQNYGYSLHAEAPDKLHNPAYTAWLIWKQRKTCVFCNDAPALSGLVDMIKSGANSWFTEGAKK